MTCVHAGYALSATVKIALSVSPMICISLPALIPSCVGCLSAAACFCWVQIIVLILSQDTSFSHNIHKVMLPGNISWYRERMLQKLSLGSLVFIVLLRCDDSPTTGSACMIRWSYGLRLWKPDHWSQCYVESCAKAVTLCDIPAGTCDAELPTAMLASYKISIYQQTHWLL